MQPENPTPAPPQTPTSQPISPIVPNVAVPVRPKRSIKKLILIIAGSIVVILILMSVALLLFVNSATKEPVAVTQQLIADFQSNNANDAYSLASPELKQTTSADQFKDIVSKEDQNLPKSKATIVSKGVSTSSGVTSSKIVANISGDNGNAGYHITVDLVKENGKWLVLDLDVKSGLAPVSSSN